MCVYMYDMGACECTCMWAYERVWVCRCPCDKLCVSANLNSHATQSYSRCRNEYSVQSQLLNFEKKKEKTKLVKKYKENQLHRKHTKKPFK